MRASPAGRPSMAPSGGKEEGHQRREGVEGEVKADAVAAHGAGVEDGLPQARHVGVGLPTRDERYRVG